jgi:hypothetical protein
MDALAAADDERRSILFVRAELDDRVEQMGAVELGKMGRIVSHQSTPRCKVSKSSFSQLSYAGQRHRSRRKSGSLPVA